MEELKWWAYLHDSGGIHVKRFFSQRDIDEAKESPFVRAFTSPYPAANREAAVAIAEDKLL